MELKVLRGADMRNPFMLYAEPHLVLSRRGDEFWLITEGEYFKRVGSPVDYGFTAVRGFKGSYYYPAMDMKEVLKKIVEIVKRERFGYVVCTRMDSKTFQEIRDKIFAELKNAG